MINELANTIYNYEILRAEGNEVSANKHRESIMTTLQANDMAPLYLQLCEKFSWSVDDKVVTEMKKKNEDELIAIEAKITDAAANAGDTEVCILHIIPARSQFLYLM